MASGQFLWEKRMEDRAKEIRAQVPWEVEPVYKGVIQKILFYWPKDNTFTDGDTDETIFDVFQMISPNDLSMFKARPYGHTFFLDVKNPSVLIEIRHMGPSLNYNPELQREFRLMAEEKRRLS